MQQVNFRVTPEPGFLGLCCIPSFQNWPFSELSSGLHALYRKDSTLTTMSTGMYRMVESRDCAPETYITLVLTILEWKLKREKRLGLGRKQGRVLVEDVCCRNAEIKEKASYFNECLLLSRSDPLKCSQLLDVKFSCRIFSPLWLTCYGLPAAYDLLLRLQECGAIVFWFGHQYSWRWVSRPHQVVFRGDTHIRDSDKESGNLAPLPPVSTE